MLDQTRPMIHGVQPEKEQTHTHTTLEDVSLFDIPVMEMPLSFDFEGQRVTVPEKKVIIRSDTGEFMGDHSNKYKVVEHKELYSKFNEALRVAQLKTGLPIDNVTVTDRVYENGKKTIREILFNDLQHIFKNGDKVTMRTDIVNSLDGTWAYQAFGGAYRSLCLNTCVFGGQKMYHEKRKHTVGLSISASLAKVQGMLQLHNDNGEKMSGWIDKKVTDEQVAELFAGTLAKKVSKSAELGVEGAKEINQKLLDYLLHRYNLEKNSLGDTLWGAYNAATHWATHTDATYEAERDVVKNGRVVGTKMVELQTGRAGAKPHTVTVNRQDKVRTMLGSSQWLELEAA